MDSIASSHPDELAQIVAVLDWYNPSKKIKNASTV